MPINYDKNIRKCPDSVTMPQNSRVFWHMRRQCVPGPTFSSPARSASYAGKIGTGDEATLIYTLGKKYIFPVIGYV